MRKHSMVVLSMMILVGMLAMATVSMADDPFVGTWKIDFAKSKFNPRSRTALKSVTAKIEAQDNGLKIVTDRVAADGKSTYRSEDTEIFDGKDYPITGNPFIDTIEHKRIDANTVVVVGKKDGEEVWKSLDTVSKDGKTITRIQKGKNSKGENYNDTVVFCKQ